MKLPATVLVIATISWCSFVGCSSKDDGSDPLSGGEESSDAPGAGVDEDTDEIGEIIESARRWPWRGRDAGSTNSDAGSTSADSGTNRDAGSSDAGSTGTDSGTRDSGSTSADSGTRDSGSTSADSGTRDSGSTSTDSGSTSADSGSTSGGAYVRQYSEKATSGIGLQEISTTLGQPVLAGSTILIFATENNIAGNPPGSAPPNPIKIDDTSKAPYTLLRTLNDQPDWQAIMMFARYNVAAGNITARASYVGLQWQGIVAVEIAGVSASPFITSAGKLTLGATAAANNVTSGTMALGSTPVLVVGFGMNILDGHGAGTAGSGFTAVGKAWNWNGAEGTAKVPCSLLEYGKFSNPGNLAATFTPVAAGDNFGALAIAFQD